MDEKFLREGDRCPMCLEGFLKFILSMDLLVCENCGSSIDLEGMD